MHDRYLEEPPDLKVWCAVCGVCDTEFECKERFENNPHPHGCFCPVCKDRGLMTPGVLNFHVSH